MTRADLLQEYKRETGEASVVNPDGTISILYVQWLEGYAIAMSFDPNDIVIKPRGATSTYRLAERKTWPELLAIASDTGVCMECRREVDRDKTRCEVCSIKPMD